MSGGGRRNHREMRTRLEEQVRAIEARPVPARPTVRVPERRPPSRGLSPYAHRCDVPDLDYTDDRISCRVCPRYWELIRKDGRVIGWRVNPYVRRTK